MTLSTTPDRPGIHPLPVDPFTDDETANIAAGPRISRVDMAALLDWPEEPIPYLIDRFAARGDVTFLVGQAGIGKSFLALAFGAAVAAGEPVAGIPTERARVLYLDAENGPRTMVRRWRATGIPGDAIDLRDVQSLDLASAADRAYLRELIAESGADLVILDALKRLAPGSQESDNDAMLPIVAGLGQIARDLDVALLVLHHRSVKPDAPAFRGASVLIDQAQAFFGLTGDLQHLELVPLKFRLDEEPPVRALGFCRDAGGILQLEARAAGSRESDAERRAAELTADAESIRAVGGITRQGIAERFQLGGPRSGSVDQVVKQLVAFGWVETRDGRSKRFVPSPRSQGRADSARRPHLGRST